MRDFYAQVFLYGFYFADEATKKNNPYLLSHTVSNLVLFGGRIILAHNRMLFPCHKSMMAAVESAHEKPDQFITHVNDLLANPTYEKCMSFARMILSFRDPEITFNQAVSLFVENNEWNWMDQAPPLQDR